MWQCAENIQDIFVPFLLLYVLFAYIDILAEKPVFGGLLCYGAPTTAESTLACDWLHLYYSAVQALTPPPARNWSKYHLYLAILEW